MIRHFGKIHPGILAAIIGFVIMLILSVLLINNVTQQQGRNCFEWENGA